jgi:hypothetical protein
MPNVKQKWTYLLLAVLTGFVLATAVVELLISEKIGALQLEHWQIGLIYITLITASVWLGVKDTSETP